MSFSPGPDPKAGDKFQCDALKAVVVPRTADLGGQTSTRAMGDAVLAALNLTAGRIGSILRIPHSTKSSRIQECAIIQVQDKDGRIRRHRIDFIKRRHTTFGKLKLIPPAYDT